MREELAPRGPARRVLHLEGFVVEKNRGHDRPWLARWRLGSFKVVHSNSEKGYFSKSLNWYLGTSLFFI